MSKKWSQIPLELPVEPEVKPTVWVLAYFGEYFDELFATKPTIHQLIDAGVHEDHVKAVIQYGSSFDVNNNYWWTLKEVSLK